MNILPNTRKKAKELGSSRYKTGKPCKWGHITDRWTTDGTCNECRTKIRKDQYRKNHSARVEYKKQYYINNQEKEKQYASQYWKDYPEKVNTAIKKWQLANPEKYKKSYLLWKTNNPGKVAESSRMRNTLLERNCPHWDDDLINTIYRKRDKLNKQWNANFHVDHIIPLQGKNVSGLHCWANLQLLNGSLNSSKNNNYQQDW